MQNTEAAWLAGFLEGEGSFMVIRKRIKGSDSFHYDATIAATNTDHRLMKRCVEIAGGFVVTLRMNRTNARWKDAYHWRLKGTQVAPVLEAISPYLVAKREQADLLLELRRHIRVGSLPGEYGKRARTPDEWAVIEAIHARVTALNRRGHEAASGELNIGQSRNMRLDASST